MWTVGLDLGQVSDYSALAVVECEDDGCFSLRHLKRFPLGTVYTTIAAQVTDFLRTEPLRACPIVVDQTGVGRAFVDLLKPRVSSNPIIAVTITSGRRVSVAEDGGFRVPKKHLVVGLQRLMQNRQLKLPKSLPEVATLVDELHQFQVKITESANEVFGAWRNSSHDDLVLAVALACWHSQHKEQ